MIGVYKMPKTLYLVKTTDIQIVCSEMVKNFNKHLSKIYNFVVNVLI